jgi:hypothetical protein
MNTGGLPAVRKQRGRERGREIQREKERQSVKERDRGKERVRKRGRLVKVSNTTDGRTQIKSVTQ